MVRLASVRDIPRVVELMTGAHKATPLADLVEFSPGLADRQLRQHLASVSSLCLVHEADGVVQGLFVGMACDHPNVPLRMAIEVVSWIDPAYRGKAWLQMKRWFEGWAVEQGCKACSFSSKSDLRFEAMLARSGYRLAESHYLKAL